MTKRRRRFTDQFKAKGALEALRGMERKTTILDAIALLLNPSNIIVLSDADYWQRKVEDEIVIQPVLALLAAGWSVATIWECALRKPEQVTVATDRLSVWLLNQFDTLELGDREVSAPTRGNEYLSSSS